MNNRWDYARQLRGLEDKPIQTVYNYVGRVAIDWNKIYTDLKDKEWRRVTWDNWNWRVKELRDQWPFAQTESTRYISKEHPTFFSDTLGFVPDEYQPFSKLLNDLCLYMPKDDPKLDSRTFAVKINRQMPGDMLWMHYDISPADNWTKYLVFLNDWSPGQAVLWGKDAITDWKSGDVYYINAYVTPHGTVNCGKEERWLAEVRGLEVPNKKLNLLTTEQK